MALLDPDQRFILIKERLTQALQPEFLEVIDDGEKHRGHAGAAGGAGHYRVNIRATSLKDLSKIAGHRKVYAALGDLIPDEIHAVSINIQS